MQFLGKIGQIIGLRPPPLGLVPPPLGNPESTTELFGETVMSALFLKLT